MFLTCTIGGGKWKVFCEYGGIHIFKLTIIFNMPNSDKDIMDKLTKNIVRKNSKKDRSIKLWKITTFVLLGIILFTQLFDISLKPKFSPPWVSSKDEKVDVSELENIVISEGGIELPINWGDLGQRMVADGVVDEQKFITLFQDGLQDNEKEILSGVWNDKIVMDQQNSQFMLDLLWAFGLANKNDILENGEMTDEEYGGAGNFASTGGWSLSVGPAMDHYSNYTYVTLTDEQQEIVDRVSSGIYRPCCGNSTHFPDCNHGMAMLGLLELMAANSVSEEEMYNVALKVNTLWFPQTYIDLAVYFKEQGQEWDEVDAKLVLGPEYSSGQGYQNTRQKIISLPKPQQGGGGCGV